MTGDLKPSFILVHQMRAIARRRFGKRHGIMELTVLAALDRLTGRPVAIPPADPA